MDSEWVNQRMVILRAADIARDAAKRGLEIPPAELTAVNDVVATIWDQIRRELGA